VARRNGARQRRVTAAKQQFVEYCVQLNIAAELAAAATPCLLISSNSKQSSAVADLVKLCSTDATVEQCFSLARQQQQQVVSAVQADACDWYMKLPHHRLRAHS
jgi:hypothetical protein